MERSDGDGVQEMKHKVQEVKPPGSTSSSPSHEFSFTISLHPTATKIPEKTSNKSTHPHPLAIDLSPADEIFSHGQLLPLHLLSHLPVSPRSSINSLDSFTLPITKLSQHQKNTTTTNTNNSIIDDSYIINGGVDRAMCTQESTLLEPKGRLRKPKSFSLFGKWRKGNENEEATKRDHSAHHHHHHRGDEGQKRRLRLDMSHVVKKYIRLVKPFLFLKNRRGHTRQQPYSFSGNLQVKNKKELRKRIGEYSAPASMRTSPTNSGVLVGSGTLTPTSTSDSTMEELQAAIQAAIAHCKKSIAAEEDHNKMEKMAS